MNALKIHLFQFQICVTFLLYLFNASLRHLLAPSIKRVTNQEVAIIGHL